MPVEKVWTRIVAVVIVGGVAFLAAVSGGQDRVKRPKPEFPALSTMIREHGYLCPKVTHLWHQGYDERGEVFEAWCANEDLSILTKFRLTKRPDGRSLVEVW